MIAMSFIPRESRIIVEFLVDIFLSQRSGNVATVQYASVGLQKPNSRVFHLTLDVVMKKSACDGPNGLRIACETISIVVLLPDLTCYRLYHETRVNYVTAIDLKLCIIVSDRANFHILLQMVEILFVSISVTPPQSCI